MENAALAAFFIGLKQSDLRHQKDRNMEKKEGAIKLDERPQEGSEARVEKESDTGGEAKAEETYVPNAHAAGDGALGRSDEKLDAKSGDGLEGSDQY